MKRIITLLLILLSLSALAACGVQAHIHSFGEWTVTKNVTCTESGLKERYCSCGEKQTQSISAVGHSFGPWMITKEPTCTETGERERYCSCGEKQTQQVAAKGHSFGEWITTKEPTCTEPGEHERYCTCGEKQTQSVAAKGHSFGEWTTEKEPTCTADGKYTRKCANCGTKEEETISATGHQWNEATCSDPKMCSICKSTEGTALGHIFENGKCTRCGAYFTVNVDLPKSPYIAKCRHTTGELTFLRVNNKITYNDYTNIQIYFDIKKIADVNGKNSDTYISFKAKLLDSDGSVLGTTSFSTGNGITVGETLKNKCLSFTDLILSDGQSLRLVIVDDN
jgi:hypothetical protein